MIPSTLKGYLGYLRMYGSILVPGEDGHVCLFKEKQARGPAPNLSDTLLRKGGFAVQPCNGSRIAHILNCEISLIYPSNLR